MIVDIKQQEQDILRKLFSKYPGAIDPLNIKFMYLDKTIDRIRTLGNQSDFWQELISSSEITFNGNRLKNLPYIMKIIEGKVNRLIIKTDIQIIHFHEFKRW